MRVRETTSVVDGEEPTLAPFGDARWILMNALPLCTKLLPPESVPQDRTSMKFLWKQRSFSRLVFFSLRDQLICSGSCRDDLMTTPSLGDNDPAGCSSSRNYSREFSDVNRDALERDYARLQIYRGIFISRYRVRSICHLARCQNGAVINFSEKLGKVWNLGISKKLITTIW